MNAIQYREVAAALLVDTLGRFLLQQRGAGLRLNGLNLLPFEFGISFDRFRTMRRCRLVRRDGDFVGVTFES
jgi:hypothetical protein